MGKSLKLIYTLENFLYKTVKSRVVSTGNSSGSILVMIIVAIVVIATLSAAMLTGISTVSFTQLGSVDTMNGFFLAEAGKTYSIRYLIDDMQHPERLINDSNSSITLLNSKKFTIPGTNGHSYFVIALSNDYCYDQLSSTICKFQLKVTGSSTPDTERTVTYEITQDM